MAARKKSRAKSRASSSAKKRSSKKRASKKKVRRQAAGPLTRMGWPLINFHPKTGARVPTGTAMNPKTGKVYPNTAAGFRTAVRDFNSFNS